MKVIFKHTHLAKHNLTLAHDLLDGLKIAVNKCLELNMINKLPIT